MAARSERKLPGVPGGKTAAGVNAQQGAGGIQG